MKAEHKTLSLHFVAPFTLLGFLFPFSPPIFLFFCSAAFIFCFFAFCLRGGISVVIRNFNQEQRCPPRHLPPDAALTLHLTRLRRRGKHCNYVEHKRAAPARWAMIKKQGVENPTNPPGEVDCNFYKSTLRVMTLRHPAADCDGLCWWPGSLSRRLINICQATWWTVDKWSQMDHIIQTLEYRVNNNKNYVKF